MPRSHHSRWTIRGIYLFALVLVLSPISDLLTTVWPIQLGELGWRYGFLGLLAGYIHTPMLGLTLALAAAHWNDDALVLRGLGYTMGALAAVLLVVMALFLIDVLQMRELRPAEARSAVLVGGLLQEAKYATACLVLVALGVGAVRTGRRRQREAGAPGIVETSP